MPAKHKTLPAVYQATKIRLLNTPGDFLRQCFTAWEGRKTCNGKATRREILEPTKSASRKCQNISPPFREAAAALKDRVSCVPCVVRQSVSLYKGLHLFNQSSA